MSGEILNRIDATIEGLCPCGAQPRPGSAWCSEDCEPVPGAGRAYGGYRPWDSAQEIRQSAEPVCDNPNCSCWRREPTAASTDWVIYERRTAGGRVDRVGLAGLAAHLGADLEADGYRRVTPEAEAERYPGRGSRRWMAADDPARLEPITESVARDAMVRGESHVVVGPGRMLVASNPGQPETWRDVGHVDHAHFEVARDQDAEALQDRVNTLMERVVRLAGANGIEIHGWQRRVLEQAYGDWPATAEEISRQIVARQGGRRSGRTAAELGRHPAWRHRGIDGSRR